MTQITLDLPSMIDGEPDEVARQVKATLNAAAPLIEQHFHQAATQLRSSWLSEQLEAEPSLDGDQLRERWHRSGYSRKVAAITRAGQLVGASVDRLLDDEEEG